MTPPHMLLVTAMAILVPTAGDTMNLIEFGDNAAVNVWRPVHDGVMGGLSTGGAVINDGVVRFTGDVSLDNNGGFASFRASVPSVDLSGFDGVRLRARGDGQVYKLSLRTGDTGRGIGWQAPFATRSGEWTTVDLAFEDLVPSWRGRLVRDAAPFDPSSIAEVGLVIADGQAGPFTLELDAITASRADDAVADDAVADDAVADDAVADNAVAYDREADDHDRVDQRSRGRALAELIDAGGDGARLADSVRWKERIVVIASPNELGADASKQLGRLLSHGEALAERQLRTVHLMGSSAGRMAGRTLAAKQVRSLRERWRLPPSEWQVALVGKDGGVKARWSSLVDPDEIFALIDAMPMRREEME